MQIGLELLPTTPVQELTIDEVARRAGISRSLLFHYFATKRDYYTAVTRAARHLVDGELLDRCGRQELEPDLHQLCPPVDRRAPEAGRLGNGGGRHRSIMRPSGPRSRRPAAVRSRR